MRILADTHAVLWWFTGDTRLSAAAHAALTSEENEIYVSAATAWEIATKSRKGQLNALPMDADRLPDAITGEGFLPLAITMKHALRAGSFPQPHGDPFDRMLAAQCEIEGLTLVTRDPVFDAFGCTTLW